MIASPRGAALTILLGAALGAPLACSSGTSAVVPPVSTTPTAPATLTWTQTWSDEFDGPAGSRVDATKWVHDLGDGCSSGNCGWGNSEKESYTDATENVSLNGQGQLAIVARPAPAGLACYYGSCRYTSGKITTRGKFSARPGRVEARIKLPLGQGLWPAFWMLGDRFPSVPWPASGELDIMEFKGSIPSSSSSAVHGPGYSGATPFAHTHTLASGNFADDFHTFAIEWDKDQARFYVDGQKHYGVSVSDLMQKGAPILDQPYFIILNLAVGGHFDGDPRSDSVVPATMLVDYVRVFNLTPK